MSQAEWADIPLMKHDSDALAVEAKRTAEFPPEGASDKKAKKSKTNSDIKLRIPWYKNSEFDVSVDYTKSWAMSLPDGTMFLLENGQELSLTEVSPLNKNWGKRIRSAVKMHKGVGKPVFVMYPSVWISYVKKDGTMYNWTKLYPHSYGDLVQKAKSSRLYHLNFYTRRGALKKRMQLAATADEFEKAMHEGTTYSYGDQTMRFYVYDNSDTFSADQDVPFPSDEGLSSVLPLEGAGGFAEQLNVYSEGIDTRNETLEEYIDKGRKAKKEEMYPAYESFDQKAVFESFHTAFTALEALLQSRLNDPELYAVVDKMNEAHKLFIKEAQRVTTVQNEAVEESLKEEFGETDAFMEEAERRRFEKEGVKYVSKRQKTKDEDESDHDGDSEANDASEEGETRFTKKYLWNVFEEGLREHLASTETTDKNDFVFGDSTREAFLAIKYDWSGAKKVAAEGAKEGRWTQEDINKLEGIVDDLNENEENDDGAILRLLEAFSGHNGIESVMPKFPEDEFVKWANVHLTKPLIKSLIPSELYTRGNLSKNFAKSLYTPIQQAMDPGNGDLDADLEIMKNQKEADDKATRATRASRADFANTVSRLDKRFGQRKTRVVRFFSMFSPDVNVWNYVAQSDNWSSITERFSFSVELNPQAKTWEELGVHNRYDKIFGSATFYKMQLTGEEEEEEDGINQQNWNVADESLNARMTFVPKTAMTSFKEFKEGIVDGEDLYYMYVMPIRVKQKNGESQEVLYITYNDFVADYKRFMMTNPPVLAWVNNHYVESLAARVSYHNFVAEEDMSYPMISYYDWLVMWASSPRSSPFVFVRTPKEAKLDREVIAMSIPYRDKEFEDVSEDSEDSQPGYLSTAEEVLLDARQRALLEMKRKREAARAKNQ